ncbi:MAG: CBS domain-containing protein [Bacteroidetes bacterium]|nr:CBS domain-containing protein [Bacteroidota bacterium]
MFAQQLISSEVFPLKKSDTSDAALHFMIDWRINNLPVVENNKLLGYIYENNLLDKVDEKIEKFLSTQEPINVKPETHLFELLKIMNDNMLSSIAVVDSNHICLGCVVLNELQMLTYPSSGLNHIGGVIVLETNISNYSLAEIARISEVNGLKILHAQLHTSPDDNNLQLISLKFNSLDLQYTLATFKRFNHKIYYSSHNEIDENQESKYNWLIKYINT